MNVDKFDIELDFEGSFDDLKLGIKSIQQEYSLDKKIAVNISHSNIHKIVEDNSLIPIFYEKKYFILRMFKIE